MMPDNNAEFLKSQGFSPTLPKRFWAKVNKTESCWLWTASKHPFGYGTIFSGIKGTPPLCAHAVSWVLHNGPISKGLCVLWLGTKRDNTNDAIKKGTFVNALSGKGERHPMCKITKSVALDILRMRKQGQSLVEIANQFAVHKTTISRVVRGKGWFSEIALNATLH
jgi:hypothetical protein